MGGKGVNIPQSYSVTSSVSGSLDMDLDEIRVKELPTIKLETAITALPTIRSESTLNAGLDDIRLTQLAPVKIELSMKPTRVHMPVNLRFGIELLGFEVLGFSVCGENMVIVEDYEPHRTEVCL